MPRGRPRKEKPINDAPFKPYDEAVNDFTKNMVEVMSQMQTLREHFSDFRKSYDENGWLPKEEQAMLIKAYRLFSKDIDMEDLQDLYEKVKASVTSGFRTVNQSMPRDAENV
jgi:hypothetical protein